MTDQMDRKQIQASTKVDWSRKLSLLKHRPDHRPNVSIYFINKKNIRNDMNVGGNSGQTLNLRNKINKKNIRKIVNDEEN